MTWEDLLDEDQRDPRRPVARYVLVGVFLVPMAVLAMLAARAADGDWLIGRGPAEVLRFGCAPSVYVIVCAVFACRSRGWRRAMASFCIAGVVAAFLWSASWGPSHYPFG